MTVRDYEPSDKAAVEKLHKDMGMDYKLPNLDDPLFIVRKVFVHPDGTIVGTEFLKIQAEAYLMLDCNLDPVEKTRVIAHLSRVAEDEAYYKHGLDTLVAYIPEEISKKFNKRLNLLGWGEGSKSWVTWTREL